jgi:hypothetical protein
MADSKVSDLTSAGALGGTELVYVVQGGDSRKTTAQDIADLSPATPPGGSSGQLQYNDGSGFSGANVWREDANTLALRNGATAQASYAYNTFTDAVNYERGAFLWDSNVLTIGTQAAGTGTLRETKLIGSKTQLGSGYTYGNTFVQVGSKADGSDVIPTGLPYAANTIKGGFRVAHEATDAYPDTWRADYQSYTSVNITTGGSGSYYATDFEVDVASTDTKTTKSVGVFGGVSSNSAACKTNFGLQFFAANYGGHTNGRLVGSECQVANYGSVTGLEITGLIADLYNESSTSTLSRMNGLRVLYWDEAASSGLNFNCLSLQSYNRSAYFAVGSDYYRTTYYFQIDGYGNFANHNAWSSAGANLESGVFKWATNVLEIGTEAAGTGTLRSVKVKGANITLDATEVSITKKTAIGVYDAGNVSSSVTLNHNNGEVQKMALTGSVTSLAVSNFGAAGKMHRITLEVTNGGAYTLAWPAGTKWAGGVAPTLTSGAGKIDIFTLITLDGGTTIYGNIIGQDYA